MCKQYQKLSKKVQIRSKFQTKYTLEITFKITITITINSRLLNGRILQKIVKKKRKDIEPEPEVCVPAQDTEKRICDLEAIVNEKSKKMKDLRTKLTSLRRTIQSFPKKIKWINGKFSKRTNQKIIKCY